jgi:hypothetical protein
MAIEKSMESLNDISLFPNEMNDPIIANEFDFLEDDNNAGEAVDSVPAEEADMGSDDSDNSDEGSDDDDPTERIYENLGGSCLRFWNKRKKRIESDFSIAAWVLCVMPEVIQDVASRFTGKHQDAVDRVIEKMYSYNELADIGKIKDDFWTEHKTFINKTYPFDKPSRWLTGDVMKGRSHLWHDKYSLNCTEVLGHVAVRTTSKVLGIGPAERAWGDVKHLKDGKRSHLSADATEKQSVLYTTARITEARITRHHFEALDYQGPSAMWGEDDVNFDLQLESFGIDSAALAAPVSNRVFRAWIEVFEEDALKKNDAIKEALLLNKYKDLAFYDPDNKITYTIHPGNLEYQRGRGGGWCVIAVPPDQCGFEEEPWLISLMLIELIRDTQQADNITVLTEEIEDDNATESE